MCWWPRSETSRPPTGSSPGHSKHGPRPSEVTTDRAPAYPRAVEELLPTACHITEQYANNPVEADHARLKARLRPMRGLKRLRSARVISSGHAFIQNLRRGHYELAVDSTRAIGSPPPSPNSPTPSDHDSTTASHARIPQTQQRPSSNRCNRLTVCVRARPSSSRRSTSMPITTRSGSTSTRVRCGARSAAMATECASIRSLLRPLPVVGVHGFPQVEAVLWGLGT
jgi:DDE domain